MKLGSNMKHSIDFAHNYPGWHSFDARCRATREAIQRLHARGLVEVNQYRQFRAV